jgi:MFS family permease
MDGRTRSALGPIFLIVLVDVLSLTIMIPLLPFYSQAFGASEVVVGLLFAVFSACQLVSGPVLGNLSDRYGRRPLLLISQAGMLASLLTLAFATSLWMLFLGRIISGFTAGNLTIAQAYITDHTRPDQRTRAFGVIGIAFGIGFAIGPAISGLLAQHRMFASHDEIIAAMSRPLFLAAALSGLSILTTATLLRNEKPPAAAVPDPGGSPPPAGRRLGVLEWRGYFAFFRRPRLANLLLQFFLFSIAFSVFITGFALFAEDRFHFGPEEVGYVYAYAGVLGILIQGGLLRQLSKRFGDAPLVIAGFTASTIGYFVLGVVPTTTLLLVAITITSFGHGFIRPALTARVTHVVDRHEQGVVLGLTQSLQSLAAVFAPPLGNLLIQQHLLFWWAAAAGVVSLLALVGAMSERSDEAAVPDATLPPGTSPR